MPAWLRAAIWVKKREIEPDNQRLILLFRVAPCLIPGGKDRALLSHDIGRSNMLDASAGTQK